MMFKNNHIFMERKNLCFLKLSSLFYFENSTQEYVCLSWDTSNEKVSVDLERC